MTWEKDSDDIVEIRGTLQGKAHSNRTYPTISVGDRVKLFRKPGKFAEMKEGFNHWTTRTYEVTKTWIEDGVTVFSLEGHDRPVRHHEILKVDAVEKPPRRRVVGKQKETARLVAPPTPRRRLVGKQSGVARVSATVSKVAAPRPRLVGKQATPRAVGKQAAPVEQAPPQRRRIVGKQAAPRAP